MTPELHPNHWSNGPRAGARGVVIVDGQILLLKYQREEEVIWLLPGGGHDAGETLADNARREVFEETGLTVGVGRLLVVHEHLPSKGIEIPEDIRSIYVGDAHRVDFFFECSVVGETVPTMEVAPDKLHVGFRWVSVGELAELALMPNIASHLVAALERPGDPMFSES